MQPSAAVAFDETPGHFRTRGFMRVRGAFSEQEAAAMRAAVWRVLGRSGIRECDPSTWTHDRPTHLQELKSEPVFRAAWGRPTREAIRQVLERTSWPDPTSVGGFFITFPSSGTWNVPSSGWHIDARYTSANAPPDGVRVHALMGDIEPKGGATVLLAGSHRLLHRWFTAHPPKPSARGSDHRKSLLGHPYVRDLHKETSSEDLIGFHGLYEAPSTDEGALVVSVSTDEDGPGLEVH